MRRGQGHKGPGAGQWKPAPLQAIPAGCVACSPFVRVGERPRAVGTAGRDLCSQPNEKSQN
eukprot:14682520-Alexandrium_andersonii.AAC.1